MNITVVINYSLIHKKTMRYSVQPRDPIFVKISFAKNMGKNIDKKVRKNLGGKYSQILLDHAK